MLRLASLLLLALPVTMLLNPAAAEEQEPAKETTVPRVLDHELPSLTGEKVDLAKKYDGKVLLIVNVASKCGATPQYEPLEALHEKYGEKGLAVLGFPCNQFGGQEPGSAEQIAEFCRSTYGVKFDMFAKVEVNGKGATPLYEYLTSQEAVGKDAGPVKWNFEKFLVARDGTVVKRFRTGVQPDSAEFVAAVEAELAKGEKE